VCLGRAREGNETLHAYGIIYAICVNNNGPSLERNHTMYLRYRLARSSRDRYGRFEPAYLNLS
jgi:hypothetical protein